MSNIECMTFKTGKFVFFSEFDLAVIQPKQIEARVLYETFRDLPILPSNAAKLKKDLIKRSIFGTAAIEGNSLSEEEVEAVIENPDSDQLSERAEREIANLKALYAMFEENMSTTSKFHVDEKIIKTIHKILTAGIDYHHNSPGGYRNEVVKVGDKNHGGIYTPPKTLPDIKMLMATFSDWINSEEMLATDQMVRAALAHYHLAKIHPFQDGNGRTARFVEAMILAKAEIKYLPPMMSNHYYSHLDDYFISFSASQKKDKFDITPFLSFYFDGVINCLKKIKQKLMIDIRLLSLKNFYEVLRKEKDLTQRQYDLLQILIETFSRFSLPDLFTDPVFKHLYANVSESTARRDLKKLSDLGYIAKDDETGLYEINFYVLG